jgi:predicted transcriptional regulator
VLSAKNRQLLTVIRENTPQSLAELAQQTGRKKPNLSRTLKTMQHYGLVRLRKTCQGKLIANVPYRRLAVVMDLKA